ncbi:MAG: hypothetical protein QM523_10940, partial [Candidatus Pacebacteria bacterium]|nr:hypothetical protein [Candidatus Paceibacterota bacterium]
QAAKLRLSSPSKEGEVSYIASIKLANALAWGIRPPQILITGLSFLFSSERSIYIIGWINT